MNNGRVNNYSVRKKKVLILTATFPTLANPTSGTFIYEQVKALIDFIDLVVIVPIQFLYPLKRYEKRRYLLSKVPKRQNKDGIDIRYVKYLYVPSFIEFVSPFPVIFSVLWHIVKHRENVDIIHAHMAYVGYVGVWLGKILKKTVIVTVHGSDINIGTQNLPEYRLRKKRIIWALKNCKKVIAVSKALKKKIVALGIPEGKVVFVPNIFDNKKFYPMDRKEAIKQVNAPTANKIILYVGNLVPIKGLEYLIDAISILVKTRNDFLLVMVGDGESRSLIERKINELNLNNHIRLIGRRPHNEIPYWMNACDIFVMSSLNEGWPTVISEALACGKPVVATKVGGIPEIITHEKLGLLVEPNNPAAMAMALENALDKVWESKEISLYAQAYSQERITDKIFNVYKEVTNER